MKKVLSYIVVFFVVAGCGCKERIPDDPIPDTSGSKTIIAYFFGTSLSYYLDRNVVAMKSALSNGFMGKNRFILYRQKTAAKAEIQEMYYDAESNEVRIDVLEELDTTTPLTAESFGDKIKKMVDYAPADTYSLICLGHATAWLPATPALRAYSRKYVPSMDKMPGAMVTRTIGEPSNTLLDIEDFADGLEYAGVKFDCIHFDMCFMSSIEAAYALRNVTGYIVGSPCEIMGSGAPYDLMLELFYKGDYNEMCKTFVDYYNTEGGYPSGCLTTIDCSKLDRVASAMKRVNAQPAAEEFDIRKIQSYEGRTDHWFFDLVDYCENICRDAAVVAELKTSLSECVPYTYHTDEFYSAYNNRFNAIFNYCGVALTPDEKCFEATERILESLSDESVAYNQLETQLATLEYYNLSLRQTEWYKATH